MVKTPLLVPVIVAASIGAGAWMVASSTERSLTVDGGASRVLVYVGKTGVFGFAGHDHEVSTKEITGHVELNTRDWQQSSVSLQCPTAGLRVTGKGEPPNDVPEVQRVMESGRVLDVGRFPTIAFRSRRVTASGQSGPAVNLVIEGDVTLHGVTRPLTVKAACSLDSSGALTAKGRFSLKQSDFGIEPVTAAGGTVRVKDVVDIEFVLSAR